MFRNQTATAAHGVRRSGFTLIEMLVVLLIIAILSGMVFALIGLVGKSADKAETTKRVEMLANAIEEFRAEYGKYPPVPQYGGKQPIYYEWPILNNGIIPPTEDGRQYGLSDGDANRFLSITGDPYGQRVDARLFTFGLAAFLVRRFEPGDGFGDNVYPAGAAALGYKTAGFGVSAPQVLTRESEPRNPQWYDHNDGREDKAADKRATSRMKYYVQKAGYRKDWISRDYSDLKYRNRHMTFKDAWGRDLNYESHPPYDSYRLWSNGADGQSGTDDDIVVGREAK